MWLIEKGQPFTAINIKGEEKEVVASSRLLVLHEGRYLEDLKRCNLNVLKIKKREKKTAMIVGIAMVVIALLTAIIKRKKR